MPSALTRRPRCRPELTRLEERAVPALIAWDGGPTGNGTNWLDPANWAGDQLPTSADDVAFDSTGSNPTIVLAGSTAVASIVNFRNLRLESNGLFGPVTLNVGPGGSTPGILNNGRIELSSTGTALQTTLVVAGGAVNNTDTGTIAGLPGTGGTRQLRLVAGATFANRGTLDAPGDFLVDSVSGNGGPVTNFGTFAVANQRVLQIQAPFSNATAAGLTGGVYDVAGSFRFFGSVPTLAADLTLTGPTSSLINLSLGNDALAPLNSIATNGRLSLAGGRSLAANGTLSNAGRLTLALGSTLDTAGGLTNVAGGTLAGTGTFAGTIVSPGTISPGFSPGTLNVNGAVTLSGAMDCEVAGLGPGVANDQLAVAGSVALSGPLNLIVGGDVPLGTVLRIVDNDGTEPVNGTFDLLPQDATLTVNGQTYQIIYTGGTGNDVTLTRIAAVPPRVLGVTVNAGQANETQRSRVTTLAVTFSAQVTFAGAVANAFALSRIDGAAVGGFTATANIVNGLTVVTLSGFIGAETEFGSLADGRYSVLVRASQVSAGGMQLDGDGNGTGGDDYTLNGTAANGLFRLFGDANGNGVVNALDYAMFVPAFGSSTGQPAYRDYLDFDGSGTINAFDFSQFRNRFGASVP